MKKVLVALVLTFVAISVIACSGAPTPTPAPQPTLSAIKSSGKIVAEGKVIPSPNAALGFQSSGLVTAVPVDVGTQVKKGDVLAQLDSKQLELSLAQADANLASAQVKLNQVKKGPTAEEVAAAQQNLKSAQSAYDKLLKPDPNDIATLKANVDKANAAVKQAQAAYDAVGGDSNSFAGMLPQRAQLQSAYIDLETAQTALNSKLTPSDAQVQQALAAVATAKDQLAKLTPTADDIAAAEANVKAMQAARDLAAEQLSRTKLIAPFDGTVASLDIHVGEQAVPGTPIIRLANTANMQVETTDLTELNVVNVKEGDPATLTFDAIPDLELTGKVTSIKGFGDNKQGDIVYTVVIKLDKQDPRLRWNMTAKVSLNANQ